MEEIYRLIGKIVEFFQLIEVSLSLLLYYDCCEEAQSCDKNINKKALKMFKNMDKTTLGEKLNKIKELKIFEDKNDIVVLDFLRTQRNYIIHDFYIENDLTNDEEVEQARQNLDKILKDVAFVTKALARMTRERNYC